MMSKLFLFDRNLTEKVQARQWNNTSYQYLCPQDIFASIQRSEINGIALEWKFMVFRVNPLQVRKFYFFLKHSHTFRSFLFPLSLHLEVKALFTRGRRNLKTQLYFCG